MRSERKLILLSLLILLMTSRCGTNYEAVYPTLSDGKYDSEFPYRNCSEQLEDIAGSLSKLDVLVPLLRLCRRGGERALDALRPGRAAQSACRDANECSGEHNAKLRNEVGDKDSTDPLRNVHENTVMPVRSPTGRLPSHQGPPRRPTS